MFIKHFDDLPFQITTISEIFELLAAIKKAAVRLCLEFLPPLHLLGFSIRSFSVKILKNKPSSSMFQLSLNSKAEVSFGRCSIHDWMVIFGMSSASPVILVSRSPYVCLSFSNQPFDAVKIANSSLFDLSFVIMASSFNMVPSGNTFAPVHFLHQKIRISLIKWYCPCLKFYSFLWKIHNPFEEFLRSLRYFRCKSFQYWNLLQSLDITVLGFCLRSQWPSTFCLMTSFFFSCEKKGEI